VKLTTGASVQDGKGVSSRSWQTIAQELAAEKNSNRITELADELTRALSEQASQPDPTFHDASVPPRPARKSERT